MVAYANRIVFIPVLPARSMRGFLDGIDTEVPGEDDRDSALGQDRDDRAREVCRMACLATCRTQHCVDGIGRCGSYTCASVPVTQQIENYE